MLGATFLFIQINEYVHLGFSARDLAFGSIFYSLTGLHGAHVFVGLMLLSFATIRAFRGHFGPEAKDHLGVEVPGIYWHFVDVMWIIVFSPSTSSKAAVAFGTSMACGTPAPIRGLIFAARVRTGVCTIR